MEYKPTFTPHVDCGDNVIIINAAKAVFSGKKETDKIYTRYTGYPGGQRFNTPAELRKRPDGMDKILRHAIKGMLPKGPWQIQSAGAEPQTTAGETGRYAFGILPSRQAGKGQDVRRHPRPGATCTAIVH